MKEGSLMYRMLLRTFTVVFFGLLMLSLAATAKAQFRAGVQGTVTDAAGAALPGATVTLTSKETARTQEVKANDSGFYRFSNLAPGTYSLSAENEGFKKSVQDITVKAEEVQGFDLALSTGEDTETVTVTGAGEQLLQTENANVDRAITTQE